MCQSWGTCAQQDCDAILQALRHGSDDVDGMRMRCNPRWLLLFSLGCLLYLFVTFNIGNVDLSSKVKLATSETNEETNLSLATSYKSNGAQKPSPINPRGHKRMTGVRDEEAMCQPKPRKIADCGALYRGFNTSVSQNLYTTPTACRLENLVNNCKLFRESYGYDDFPISATEADFPLAFSVKLHTNPGQFEQLLRAIYRPQNVYCIHVDKKSDASVHQLVGQISKCFDNVYVIEPTNLVYASFDHVRVELELMRTCLRHTRKWKYYINLTGKDFPLKTNLEMVEILKLLEGQNDLESFRLSPFRQKQLLRKTKIDGGNLVITNQTKEPFQYKVKLHKGSTYGLFSRDFVKFLLNDDIVRLFLDWARDVTPSEEIVWATLNKLPWAPGGSDAEILHTEGTFVAKAVLWSLDSTYCRGQVVRSVCVFGANDLNWLKDRHELFANKFDDQFDPVAIDCLEETLRKRSFSENADHLQWFRYRHLPHTRHLRNVEYRDPSSVRKSRLEKKQRWLFENI